ncbi:hypothetical protein BDZ94DRAFT_1302530 [Collybia nuda]|uniref:Uncharacterized protein n=1 Tax=Collybia nuda TaxID=64659 RepID=A0A9P5XTH2_9AGAR|nr:hypothetical protein BDZ94DRAFT_1302530 [Collybia nuda]
MEDLVESIRPSKPTNKVPISVLNGCEESFDAANEKKIKASTQFFSDTGLMALLCRHDRVLWLANMTTAGEKQYYALALLKALFDHIPLNMTVGLLYDIACQLHRSCVKWEFLDASILSRIIFGISVFHAFGHQWPCQVIYHPRKCEGFGLTDGEGCERFWSSIKLLIPSTRVSGYYRRLYTIDTQVKFLDSKSLLNLGQWLDRKWNNAQHKKEKAQAILDEINIPDSTLRIEWKAQVEEQTKPIKRFSKGSVNKAVEDVLSMTHTRTAYQEEILKLNNMIISGNYTDDLEIEQLHDQLAVAKINLEKLQLSIKQKRDALGVDGRASLAKLKDNKFLHLRLKASALKKHIRTRLRDRKFELEHLERAYRHTTSNESKVHNHIEKQVKRHEPGVVQLASKYNKLCADMAILKSTGGAPKHSIIPPKIEKEGLFKLDVDDDIWQDIGLNEDSFDGIIPAWLGDESTRKGIRAMLEKDRCLEEEKRLSLERCLLQEWLTTEWESVLIAEKQHKSNNDMLYQLQLKEAHLCKLYVLWEPKLRNIPPKYPLPESWGPSEEDIEKALELEGTASWDTEDLHSDSESESDYGDEDEELMEAAELSAFTDAYRQDTLGESLFIAGILPTIVQGTTFNPWISVVLPETLIPVCCKHSEDSRSALNKEYINSTLFISLKHKYIAEPDQPSEGSSDAMGESGMGNDIVTLKV